MALFSISIFSETTLRGDIGGLTLSEQGNPYVIEEDIIIPQGKRTTIGPGCVLLFKSFTGCKVDGALVAEGTAEKPVVFTAVNNSKYNPSSQQLPNPFDWNGILIGAQAERAEFINIVLEYSVYGIKSQSKVASIKNGIFSQNGQYHFTVEDKIQYVQDKIPFTYAGSAAAATPIEPTKPSKSLGKAQASRSAKPGMVAKDRKVVRIALLSSGIALTGLGVGLTANYIHEKQILDDMGSNPAKYADQLREDPDLWNTQTAKKRNAGVFAVLTDVAAGLCFIGFSLTYVF